MRHLSARFLLVSGFFFVVQIVTYAQKFDAGTILGLNTSQITGDNFAGYNQPGVIAGFWVSALALLAALAVPVDWVFCCSVLVSSICWSFGFSSLGVSPLVLLPPPELLPEELPLLFEPLPTVPPPDPLDPP